jgi:prepilin peptidase CpaA
VSASPDLLHLGAVVVGVLACLTDVRSRRIPNVLTFGASGAGMVAHVVMGGLPGLGWSAGGWVVGLVLLLPLFLLRGMGGGDVKLMAAFGAWVGPRLVAWTGLYGAIAGGVLALVVALSAGVLGRTFANVGLLVTHWRVVGVSPVDGLTLDTASSPKLPYAIPLTCGLVVALWLQG